MNVLNGNLDATAAIRARQWASSGTNTCSARIEPSDKATRRLDFVALGDIGMLLQSDLGKAHLIPQTF